MLSNLRTVAALKEASAVVASMLLIIGTLVFAGVPRATAAETAVEIPQGDNQSQEKQAVESSGVLEEPADGTAAQSDVAQPEAVFRSGCITRPGGSKTYKLRARGTVLYRVVPSAFFDVTLRVTYVGLGGFYTDRYFAGGTESLLIRGPSGYWPVKVKIAGYLGSTGCFNFYGTP